MSSGLDVLSGSLRVRNRTCIGSGPYNGYNCKINEVKSCPSVMSPETKRLLPPTTETVQTKPFPIRVPWRHKIFPEIFHSSPGTVNFDFECYCDTFWGYFDNVPCISEKARDFV